MHPNFAGALINGALYLLTVFVAALVSDHPLAWKMAIAAIAITFFSHVLQFTAAQLVTDRIHFTASVAVVISWIVGALAGLDLLF